MTEPLAHCNTGLRLLLTSLQISCWSGGQVKLFYYLSEKDLTVLLHVSNNLLIHLLWVATDFDHKITNCHIQHKHLCVCDNSHHHLL